MNKKNRNKLFFLLVTVFVSLLFVSELYGKKMPNNSITSSPGIPKQSGGSQSNSTLSLDGVASGPSTKMESLSVKEPVTPKDPAVSTTFEGFNFDDNATENGGNVFIPPDPIGAAGTDRLIAVVNTMIEARTKGGVLLFRDSLADFFAPLAPLTFTFDPKVIYDPYEDRFLVVSLERIHTGINPDPGNESRIFLAVSTTGTPATATAADWEYHVIDAETSFDGYDHWADYPGFEVDEEAIYLTANMFEHPPGPGGTYGVRLWLIDKGVGVGGFYDGGPVAMTVHNPYAAAGFAGTTMPCQIFDPAGVGPGIGTFLVSYSGLTFGGPGASEVVQVIRIDDPLGAPAFTQETVNIGDIEDIGGTFGWPALPDAPQNGTATLIEVNDRRALDCVWRDDSLWFTSTINPNAGPDIGQTTAHWFQLDTSAIPGAITLADQGNIGGEDIAAGTYTFFPAIAVNSTGTAQFGFSASAPTIYAGAYVTGRTTADPAGTVQGSTVVHAGEDYYIRAFGGTENRWGDYSGIALDPLDDDLFWVFNEYAALRGTTIDGEDGRWGTAWASSTLGPTNFPVDVFFLVDLSGSFADDLPVFQAEAPGIISTMSASNPDTRFGLGSFEDYPITPFGGDTIGDVAYRRDIDLTFDTLAVDATIAALFTRWGADWPQSQLPAVYQAATGLGQDLSAEGYPGASIPPLQQANFRSEASKIFLLWTDAPFHYPGDPGDIPYPGPSFTDTVNAVLALAPAKVIGIASGGDPATIADLEALAAATGALAPIGGLDCDGDSIIDVAEGDPLVCITPPTGEGISEVIVSIIKAATKITIKIDIKPDSNSNPVNLKSRGGIPVAILGAENFDVGVLDVTTLQFGPTGSLSKHDLTEPNIYAGHLKDVNYDGHTDLMVHFYTQDTGITCGDSTAVFTGRTIHNQLVEGSDIIKTLGCK